MYKFLFFVLIYLLVSQASFSKVLNGGISYSVNEARSFVFSNLENTVDVNQYKDHFLDTNFDKNLRALSKNQTQFRDRFLSKFDDETYAVMYKNNQKISYYYDLQGKLEAIEKTDSLDYPRLYIRFCMNGKISTVSLWMNVREQFVFNENKKLVAHWIGRNCYNEKGELINTRNSK